MSKWLLAFPVMFLIGGAMLLPGDSSPTPQPVIADVLGDCQLADRVSQVAVLRELAAQPFDGTTDDGRRQAGEWFTAQRFRNRANDFGAYTDAVAEAIAANSEAALADSLEVKR